MGITLHPDTMAYVADPQALADAIGGNSRLISLIIFRLQC